MRMFFLWVLLFLPCQISAQPFQSSADTGDIPPELRQWIPWVLEGKEDRFCPSRYDTGDAFFCTWPSRLTLDLDDRGGHFTQQWTVFKKSWVELPGTLEVWPENLTIDGKKAIVLKKGDVPSVEVEPGAHIMEGAFAWSELPEVLSIPGGSGIVNLSLGGRKIEFPVIDKGRFIWLQKQKAQLSREDRTEVHAFRLAIDSIPMLLITRLELIVSGKPREITIPGVLLPKLVPMEISSQVPARLCPDGGLLIQAMPGRWDIRITSRSLQPVNSLGPVDTIGDSEVWAFEAKNDLRMVKIEGVKPIDPGQTDLPDEWKTYPAYVVDRNATVRFKMLRRGDPDPAPDQLRLKRVWWLDFDGKGYTVQDTMTGTMSRQWYLAMNPPGDLGHVSVDGTDRLITSQGPKGKSGIELRKGYLDLVAESRYARSGHLIPAVGWDVDVQSLDGLLNLPPGWKLLGATGVDSVPGTWLSRWTLLDLFLVLITALAIGRLWSLAWGLIALITLALIFQETGAPRLVWLNLLASIALLRFVPEGLFRKAVGIWGLAAFVGLVVLAVPFMVGQIRMGIYPQLEQVSQYGSMEYQDSAGVKQETVSKKMSAKQSVSRAGSLESSDQAKVEEEGIQRDEIHQQDLSALIQTGPGLPDWSWQSYPLRFNGPVDRAQTVSLWLIPPSANLVLAILRVLLLALLIYRLIPREDIRKYMRGAPLSGAIVLITMLGGFWAGQSFAATAFPSRELLKELEQRVLKKPDCYPACAQIEQMSIVVQDTDLTVRMLVHAAVRTAVPLPSSDLLRPAEITLDAKPGDAVLRDETGTMWMLVPEGVHEIGVSAKAPPVDEFDVSIPMKPHRVTVKNTGWEVRGIDRQGRVQDSIKFVHTAAGVKDQPASSVVHLPPFLSLERKLLLGLKWQVSNTLTRLTPQGAPVGVSIPLIAGESVTTPGISVDSGMVQVQMRSEDREISWISSLPVSRQIIMQAPDNVPWTEEWVLDADSIWHCELSGIPVIHYKNTAGTWNPRWMPWPGERIQITVSRPQAVSGRVLTVEEVRFTHSAGRRLSSSELDLKIRSSQGTQQKVAIPKDAGLEQVTIMGSEQPIRAQNGEITLPIRPGMQDIHIKWHERQETSLVTVIPKVDVGLQAVNAHITLKLPRNRWVLFAGGPRLGPAVLFWSYLFVMVIISLGLGQVTWTPLKRHQWFLLSLGLTQVHPALAVVIVGWLLGLGLRERQKMPESALSFNTVQVSLAVWTVAALAGLYMAIERGLLGIPDMQVAGNASSDFTLNWTQDRIPGELPRPWVLTCPLMVYRILMLMWALWIAVSLLKWMRWGWDCFRSQGLWKKTPLPRLGKDPLIPGE